MPKPVCREALLPGGTHARALALETEWLYARLAVELQRQRAMRVPEAEDYKL